MKYIDNFLNSVTMYRLVLYALLVLSFFGIGFSATGLLNFSAVTLLASLILLVSICELLNKLMGKLFSVAVNVESSYITALILFLILPPVVDLESVLVNAFCALVAVFSKYIINVRGRHVFNPAAISVLVLSLTGLGVATWWVASGVMLIPCFVVGFLVAKKTRRLDLVIIFILISSILVTIQGLKLGSPFFNVLTQTFTSWPILFFGSIMLTEPATMPPTKKLIWVYGTIVALLFGSSYNFGVLTTSPELALVVGNIFAFVLGNKIGLQLTFVRKIQMAPLVYDFVFSPNFLFHFTPGQYLAWTIPVTKPDSRGNRRFFTIASSPTEKEIHLGVKIPSIPSAFKKQLLELAPGDKIFAGQLSGDFILSNQDSKRIVAIAGGIGITPFRSMVKNAIDKNVYLDMVLLYASADPAEFVYKDIFTEGEKFGIKTVYILSGAKDIPVEWKGPTGYITKELVEKEVLDYKDREFYLSGPNVMVDSYKKLLLSLNIPRSKIRTDYFPGY